MEKEREESTERRRTVEHTQREADEALYGTSKLETLAKDFLIPRRASSTLPFLAEPLFMPWKELGKDSFSAPHGVQPGFQSHHSLSSPLFRARTAQIHTSDLLSALHSHEIPYSPSIIPFFFF